MNTRCRCRLALGLAVALACGGALHADPPGDFEWVDVDHLAACDGTTDDTDEIQAAFDAVDDGGTVVFPPGKICVYSATLLIDEACTDTCSGGTCAQNQCKLVIEGNGAILRFAGSASCVAGIKFVNSQNFEIRNLTVDGNRPNCTDSDPPGANHNFLMRGARHGVFYRVRSINSPVDGFYMRHDLPDRVEDLAFIEVVSEGSYRNGFGLADVTDVRIVRSRILDTAGTEPEAGINIETADGQTIEKVLVTGNHIEGNDGIAIKVTENDSGVTDDVIITDNVIRDNHGGALRIKGSHVTVRGNHFRDFSYDSAETAEATVNILDPANDVAIDGNLFENIDTGYDVVYVVAVASGDNSRRISVTNNRFRGMTLTEESRSDNTQGASVVRYEANDGAVTGNQFFDLGVRAIFAKGDYLHVSGNTVARKSSGNVFFVNGDSNQITHNLSGTLEEEAGGTTAESVYILKGDGGLVQGNTLSCPGDDQRGILIYDYPGLITDNVAKGCATCVGFNAGQTGIEQEHNVLLP